MNSEFNEWLANKYVRQLPLWQDMSVATKQIEQLQQDFTPQANKAPHIIAAAAAFFVPANPAAPEILFTNRVKKLITKVEKQLDTTFELYKNLPLDKYKAILEKKIQKLIDSISEKQNISFEIKLNSLLRACNNLENFIFKNNSEYKGCKWEDLFKPVISEISVSAPTYSL